MIYILDTAERELFELFHIMDTSETSTLKWKEFQVFMEALGVTYSRRRWQQIFRQIDRNYDRFVSNNQYLLFI